MTDVVVQKLVYRAELDAREAERQARSFETRVAELTQRQKELTRAEVEQAKASKALREEVNRLSRSELEAGADVRTLARQRRVAQQSLREQTEATRGLRLEQAALRREERMVTADRQRAERVLRETAGFRGRTARADDRLRNVYRRQGDTGGRIEALQASLEGLDAELAGVNSRPGARLRRGLGGFGERMRDGLPGAAGRFASGLPGAALGAGRVAAGGVALAGGAVAGVARAGGEFESLRGALGTALGSDAAGEKAFAQVRQFAKETPFAVKEVVQAVTTLKVRGLEPTVESAMEALRTYGDVAGALGQSLPDVINAVSSASVGEFEELKQKFNVIGHKAGDEIKFTFAGVTTTVKNDSKSIVEYLKTVGKTNFSGGMEKQAKTLGGVWSNLGDAVMMFSDEIYRAGLGDALKDVLKDITGNVEGSSTLAQTIGEKLATAVRDAYEWLKQMLGPMDELPKKFADAYETGKQFVSAVVTIVSAGVELASTLDADGLALVALTVAAGAALGPLGALAAASFAVGAAIGSALADGETHLESLQKRVGSIRSEVNRAEIERLQKETTAQQEDLEKGNKRLSAREKAGERVMRAELRAIGVTTAAEAAALPEAERLRITRLGAQARASFDRPTLSGSTELADLEARAGGFAQGREHMADKSELRRLTRLPKSKRTKAVEKRIGELSETLGVRKATAGSGKPELTAFEAEQKKIIEDRAKHEGLRAADAALLSGRGAEAAGLSRTAERETRARLKAQAAAGQGLPGELDLAFGRVAGYSDVAGQPPPPIVVNNFKIDIHGPLAKVEGNFSADPKQIGDIAAARLVEVLETDVFPQVAQLLQPGFIR